MHRHALHPPFRPTGSGAAALADNSPHNGVRCWTPRPALAATRAPGHEPHDDDDGHGDQPDDEKRLERCNDPAHSRDGKRYGEDRADDCPDDPAHVPSMRPGPGCRMAPAAMSWP